MALSGCDGYLYDVRNRPHDSERVIGSMHVFVEPQDHLYQGHQKRDQALRPARLHGGSWIRDHKEDEELIHGAGNWRHFRQERVPGDETSNECQRDERNNVCRRDVKSLNAYHDQHAENPDDEHGPDGVSPLNAQCQRHTQVPAGASRKWRNWTDSRDGALAIE